MRKILFLTLFVCMAAMFIGCDEMNSQPSADAVQAAKTEKAMREADAQIGMPAIVNFQERKLAKMIFELRDQEKLITYAYIVNKMTGQLVFVGKCVGYGLPYSVQYTNPKKVNAVDGGQYGAQNPYVLPQPDPNGLFMPEGLSATWLMLIDPATKKPRPVYFEPQVIVSPFLLH